MSSTPSELYPQYCFHLAPTFNEWCILRAKTVHGLRIIPEFAGQQFHFHDNLPIRWVRIVGVVVAIDDFHGRRVFTVDDGSGACIECSANIETKPAAAAANPGAAGAAGAAEARNAFLDFGPGKREFKQPGCEDVQVGSVVDVKGGVSVFREEKTIKIEKVKVLESTEQEVALWDRRTAFERDVLRRPWVLTEKQVRRCKREAHEDVDEKEARKEKKRRRGNQDETRESREERKVAIVEPEVVLDGFGRPKRLKGSGSQATRSSHVVSGSSSSSKAKEDKTRESREERKAVTEPRVVLDGFGRPKRLYGLGSQSLSADKPTSSGSSRSRGKEDKTCESRKVTTAEPKVALDGFGRPKRPRGSLPRQ